MTAARIRVLCVDDHRIVREGIALIIAQQPDLREPSQAWLAGQVLHDVGQVLSDLPHRNHHARAAS